MNILTKGSHPDSYWQGVEAMIKSTSQKMPNASASQVMGVVATNLRIMIQNNRGVVNTVFK